MAEYDAPADCLRWLCRVLDDAGIGREIDEDAVVVHLGVDDPFVRTFSMAAAEEHEGDPGGCRWTATLVTAPFVADRDRDHVLRALPSSPLPYNLRRAPGRSNALVVHKTLAQGDEAGTLRELRQAFEEQRDLARAIDRPLFFAQPEMARLREATQLEQAGRVPQAIAAARRGLHQLRRSASPRVMASHQIMLGSLLYTSGQVDEAAPHLDAGLATLGETDPWTAAVAELVLAQVDLDRARPDLGLERCERGIAGFERAGSSVSLASARTRKAQMLLALHQPDEARRVLVELEAEVAAPAWPGPRRQLGDVRLLVATAMAEIGDLDAAGDYIDAARTAYARCGADDGVANCETTRRLLDARMSLPMDAVWEAAARWDVHGGEVHDDEGSDDDRGTGQRSPNEATASTAPPGTPESILPLLAMMRSALERQDFEAIIGTLERAASDKSATGLSPAAKAALDGVPIIRRSMDLARTGGPPGSTPEWNELGEASLVWSLQQLKIVGRQPRLESVADRQRWAQGVSTVLVGAINGAIVTNRPRLAHFLLERARAQGLPDVDATRAAQELLTGPLPAESEAGPEPGLDEPDGPVSVSDEKFRLDFVRASLSDLTVGPVELNDQRVESRWIGGPGAWRWTMWQAGGLVFWSVLRPDGEAYAGFALVDMGSAPPVLRGTEPGRMFDDQLAGPLARLRRALGVGLAARPGKPAVVTDALMEDPDDAEPDLAWDVGRLLIPLPLRLELIRRLDAGEPPLPLVIAPSPAVVDLPFALLAVDEPTPEQPLGRRLVEAAVVTIAPPAALVSDPASASGRPGARPTPLGGEPDRKPGPLPIRLAVVNPDRSLTDSEAVLDDHLDTGSDGSPVFGRVRATDVAERARPATREAIVGAMAALPAGSHGVLVWAGHARRNEVDARPLDPGLVVEGTDANGAPERVTVRDIILDNLHAPRRAVLYGCSTIGNPHLPIDRVTNDAAEWWGLPIALLYAGASAVIATSWDVLDCPASARLAGELVTCARTADDLPRALREVQLRALARWREQRRRDRTFTGTVDDCHPHIWAAWSVVGVAGG